MQQPPQMIPVLPSFPPTNITTEQIQKYLDENKKLILAILDNQNLGKLAECAQYQTQLQKNLMYLAAIADAQPQAPPMPPQMAPHQVMQQGGYFMQHPQRLLLWLSSQAFTLRRCHCNSVVPISCKTHSSSYTSNTSRPSRVKWA
ncbi:hypothetical protein EUGRSUZ_L00737 [Eucalyptus grandis]|uniref:Uncharacterized protein n=2 Tax=Eucalyptus grandis TaxID=71139 RepID=A0ACC3JZ82_EUCGR|nr:hypothetical protein EUGRSUZ_L00737 [Eucalyptus grandis]